MLFLFSSDLVNPLSISIDENAIKTAKAPINPYSDGANALIKIMPEIRFITCCPNLSTKLQNSDMVVLCFNEGSVINGFSLSVITTKLDKFFLLFLYF